MRNKELNFNLFFNNDGEELEDLIIQALINYLSTYNSGFIK